MSNEIANKMAKEITKEQLLKRMASYVKDQAKRKKVPEWSIVGHIFAQGSGVSSSLCDLYIFKEATDGKG